MEKPPIGFAAWAPQCPAQWLRRIVFSWHIADARKYPPLLKSHCVPAILLPVPSEHRWPAKARHRYGEDRGNECAVNCSWQATSQRSRTHRQTVLRFSAGDGCCNNGRTKVIPHIILDNKDRADAALLGTDHRVQVCIEQIATPDSLSHKLTS